MSDIGPGRGSRPRYLGRPLTEAERARVYRARKAGKPAPVIDPFPELRGSYAVYMKEGGGNALYNLLQDVRAILEKHKC